jgi:hypothetical protein
MRVTGTIVLGAVALLLAGGYYVLEVRGREAREAARAAERRLVQFDPAGVREIEIDTRAERVLVRAGAGGWRLVAPAEGPADGPTVEGLLDFVRRLEKVRTLEGAADLAGLGLDAPAARLRLTLGGGETLALRLGGPNPARTGIYAMVEGTALVFLAPARLGTELAKTPYADELRDRTILAIAPERVRRLEIARADTQIVVDRTGPRAWRVERPFRADGDDGIIRDLLWKVGAARSHAVIATAGPPAEYGLDRPHARLTVTEDGGGRRVLTVVAPPADPGALYARLDGGASVHVTGRQLLADLAIAPDLLRNRQLLVFDEREVERITIRYPATSLVIERAAPERPGSGTVNGGTGAPGAEWRVGGAVAGEAAPGLVENLLEVLPNLRHGGRERPPARDRSGLGLDPPRLAVTVGLRGGRTLPTLAIGAEEAGRQFVMVGEASPVYTVDARLIRVIPADPADAKRYPLPDQLRRGLEKLEREGGRR